jgi:23S rRNA (cytidine1920-2'-O)/16S rRNA (cytidine1409-2'-O)-methyltransferase
VRESRRYVSRGGDKLAAAIERWRIPVEGKVYLDAGSSSGGFTDCLLQAGASLVYAVDVGRNQLDYKLRVDPRVVVMERTNIMEVMPEQFAPAVEAAVADLSFRSLRGAAPQILHLTSERYLVALAKPQFEWRQPHADFDGVIRDRQTVTDILSELLGDLEKGSCHVTGIMPSPIPGRTGNREFLLRIQGTPGRESPSSLLDEAVHEAFSGDRAADERPL